MPRCEGIPGGPCPGKVNNAAVKRSQGDMMLCKDCEIFRFPYLATNKPVESQNGNIDRRQTTEARIEASSHNIHRPDEAPKMKTRSTRNIQAATGSNLSVSSPDDLIADNCDKHCADCQEVISIDRHGIQCVTCKNNYDQQCTGLSMEVFTTLKSIIDQVGWICLHCHSNLNKLQNMVIRITEEIADMRVSMAWLFEEVNFLKSAHTQPVTRPFESVDPCSSVTDSCQTVHQQHKSDLKTEIHRTINYMNLRKCNVVISGHAEGSVDDTSVEDMFYQFCEENLTIKPVLAKAGCRRLGRINDPGNPSTQPRKLLVHLRSEESAASLLSAGKLLRQSENPEMKSVYINPDLSPGEARLAYEARQRRRERRSSRIITNRNTDNNSSYYSRNPLAASNDLQMSSTSTASHPQPSETHQQSFRD